METWTEYVRKHNIGYSGTWLAFNSILAMAWISGALFGAAVIWAVMI